MLGTKETVQLAQAVLVKSGWRSEVKAKAVRVLLRRKCKRGRLGVDARKLPSLILRCTGMTASNQLRCNTAKAMVEVHKQVLPERVQNHYYTLCS